MIKKLEFYIHDGEYKVSETMTIKSREELIECWKSEMEVQCVKPQTQNECKDHCQFKMQKPLPDQAFPPFMNMLPKAHTIGFMCWPQSPTTRAHPYFLSTIVHRNVFFHGTLPKPFPQ